MTQTGESLPRVPDKQYFRIGEVSRIVGVPAYVLRFWETEFPRIKPRRTGAGQRLYHRNDLALIIKIKTLLYEQKYTIKGARKHLADPPDPPDHPEHESHLDTLKVVGLIKDELLAIRNLLN